MSCIVLLTIGCEKKKVVPKKVAIPYQYAPLTDTTIQKMIAWEQVGDIDKTDQYLFHNNPAFRYQAVHPYTTPRYQERVANLFPLLQDTIPEVRRQAIYAVGQSADKNAIEHLQLAYHAWDSFKVNVRANSLILEAIGKCGARPQLDQLASIKTFDIADSTLILGQVRGMFQLLLKGIHSEDAVEKISTYFFSPQYPLSIRQLAGYYLLRGKSLNLDKYEFALGKILRSDEHYTLRTYAAGVMANSGSNKYVNALKEQLGREQNDQVKLNILRAMYKMPYSRVKNDVYKEIRNPNVQISRMAARFFLLNGQQEDAAEFWDKVKNQNLDNITTANFAAATAKNLPFYYALTRNAAINKILSKLRTSADPYEKAQLLQVLAELPEYSKNIVEHYKSDAHPVIKSQTVFSIQKAVQVANKDRKYVNTANTNALRLFDKIIQDKDIGALAAMAYVLRDTAATNLHQQFRRAHRLKPILDSLSLPAELETYNEIAMLLNSYGDKTVSVVKASTFKSFDQSLFQKLSSTTSAIVETTAGTFEIKFYIDESPISVSNFISLAEAGYYNDKIFHRVVPNFVIQTGCHRGDGYGSQEYVIRSELGPLHYEKAGQVGMASAGIDTESSQWFVTHIPVFHLDGRYTIFAHIVNGMDVVNKINVGDKIISIKINY